MGLMTTLIYGYGVRIMHLPLSHQTSLPAALEYPQKLRKRVLLPL